MKKTKNNWEQGVYKLTKPEKYIGNKNPIVRSSYEKKFFVWAEQNKNVVRWGSEIIQIPYVMPDNSKHMYITDAYVEIIDKNGNIRKFIVEIKPHGQGPTRDRKGMLKLPKPPKNRTAKALKNYLYKKYMFEKNTRKWQAAQIFCKKNNLEFIVLTEKDLL